MHRVGIVFAGQTPRPDFTDEGVADVSFEFFGALDGLSADDLRTLTATPDERRLLTLDTNQKSISIPTAAVSSRMTRLIDRLDAEGFAAIVVMSTGIFSRFRSRTPLIHGQEAVDAWIEALVMGDCQIGLIYPLSQHGEIFAAEGYGTMLYAARSRAHCRSANGLAQASKAVREADLILLHSVGYTDDMAAQVSRLTGRPVVTARRIILGTMRARLKELSTLVGPASASQADFSGAHLVDVLEGADRKLTNREREVMGLVIAGDSNKAVAEKLAISHRTVDIHRSRGMAKLGGRSIGELVRRAMMLATDRAGRPE